MSYRPSCQIVRLGAALFAVMAVAAVAGCGAPGTVEGFNPDEIQPVSILDQHQGSDSALTETRVELIRSAEDLEALGTDLALPADAVNFDEHSLVLVALGTQNTGGYWAKIVGLQRVGDQLWVEAVANAPGEDDVVTQAITHPFTVAIVPRVEDQVVVEHDIRSVTGRTPDDLDDNAWID